MSSRQEPPRGAASTASRKSGKAARNQSVRDRIAAQRAAERNRDRMRWIAIWAVTAVTVAVLAAVGIWAVVDQSRKADLPAALPKPVHQGSETAMPPWPLPADPVSGAKAAGLDVQPMEGTAKHFHAHLDVIVNGKPVKVPGDIGVSPAQQAMSELHTHDDSGMLHIEAPTTNKRYTLGQVFDEWQVKLSTAGIGGLRADSRNTLVAYVDGKPLSGDPATIELLPHRQIALVYGPAGAKVDVPKSYDFPPGQ
jgi:hypothetical protein